MRRWLAVGACLGLMACSSGKGPDADMPNPHTGPGLSPTTRIPTLDADAPATVQTATFALG